MWTLFASGFRSLVALVSFSSDELGTPALSMAEGGGRWEKEQIDNLGACTQPLTHN